MQTARNISRRLHGMGLVRVLPVSPSSTPAWSNQNIAACQRHVRTPKGDPSTTLKLPARFSIKRYITNLTRPILRNSFETNMAQFRVDGFAVITGVCFTRSSNFTPLMEIVLSRLGHWWNWKGNRPHIC
jgi:hypothetical protein